jgi:hypothetical protein
VTSTIFGLRQRARAALLALADLSSGDSFAAFARAAFRAICSRRREDSFSRRAWPPFEPISRKNGSVTRWATYARVASPCARNFRVTKCRWFLIFSSFVGSGITAIFRANTPNIASNAITPMCRSGSSPKTFDAYRLVHPASSSIVS